MNLPEFKNVFSVSKTLCFALEPVGNTAKYVANADNFKKDKDFKENLPLFKKRYDAYHRNFINAALAYCAANAPAGLWHNLVSAWPGRFDKKNGGKERWDEAYNAATMHILASFKEQPDYKLMTKDIKKLIVEHILPDSINDSKEYGQLKCYAEMSDALKDLQNNRSFFYNSSKKGSIAYRIVYENLRSYSENILAFRAIQEKYPSIILEMQRISQERNPDASLGYPLSDLFEEGSYGLFLTQKGINYYNAIISGYTTNDELVKGLNNLVNEYAHKNKLVLKEMPKFVKLKKQILSSELSLSYVPHLFKDDDAAYNSMKEFATEMRQGNIALSVKTVIDNLDTYNEDAITFSKRNINYISNKLFGNWDAIKDDLKDMATEKLKTKAKIEKFVKKDRFTLAEINDAIAKRDPGNTRALITGYFKENFAEDMAKLEAGLTEMLALCAEHADMVNEKKNNPRINQALFNVKAGFDTLSMLVPKEKELDGNEDIIDEVLDADLRPLYDTWQIIVPLLMAVQSRCTGRPYVNDKVEVRFDNPSLLTGWSDGKNGYSNISGYGGMLLQREGKIFLAILARNFARGNTKKFKLRKFVDEANADGSVERFSQSKLNVKKMLAGIAKIESSLDEMQASPYLRDVLASGKYHQKDLPIEETHRILTELIPALARHGSFAFANIANFLKNTTASEYDTVDEFLDACEEHSYQMTLKPANGAMLDAGVEEGSVLLFEITSTGLKQHQRGVYVSDIQAIHLLDALNGQHDTELLGNAQIYRREASIKNPIVHKSGTFLVNRRKTDGTAMPEGVHDELYRFYNGMLEEDDLSQEAKDLMNSGQIIVKQATKDIVKDKAFTQDKLIFHVPVLLGASCSIPEKKSAAIINKITDEWMKKHPKHNILAINRGENNLLYATLVDSDNKILEQRSFNVLDGIDFRDKINERTKNISKQRKNWQQQDTIKDLKKGFVMNAIREISKMAFDNEAIIVLESLDDKFKNSRAQLGQTVYRMFENMLIDRLRWYVPDKNKPHEVWQLTSGTRAEDKNKSYRNGIVFFVPAWGTSSMDPVTGFVSMLPFYAANTAEKKREFLAKFTDVKKEGEDYIFTFNNTAFGVAVKGAKNEWTVSSAGQRLVVEKDDKGVRRFEIMYPSVMLALNVEDGNGDIKKALSELKGDKLDDAFKAVRLMMQMRNCDIGARDYDWFASPVPGGFDSRKAASDMPATTDAVTAYNMARKARLMIETGQNSIDKNTWYTYNAK